MLLSAGAIVTRHAVVHESHLSGTSTKAQIGLHVDELELCQVQQPCRRPHTRSFQKTDEGGMLAYLYSFDEVVEGEG